MSSQAVAGFQLLFPILDSISPSVPVRISVMIWSAKDIRFWHWSLSPGSSDFEPNAYLSASAAVVIQGSVSLIIFAPSFRSAQSAAMPRPAAQ